MLLYAVRPVQSSKIQGEIAPPVLVSSSTSSCFAPRLPFPAATRDSPGAALPDRPMLSALDRQIFAAWSRRRFRSDTRSPRAAVVGACQSVGVGYGLRLLLPQAAVDIYQVLPGTLLGIERLAGTLRNYDLVFSSEFPSGFVRGGNSNDLQELVSTI